MKIIIFDRKRKREMQEKVQGERILHFLYKKGFFFSFMRLVVSHLSFLFGLWNRIKRSKKYIASFIREFEVDPSEFEKSIDQFHSFNDFFIRKLKPESRPIERGEDIAVLPADARYLVFPNIEQADGFYVKGEKFSLSEFLQDGTLAKTYQDGAMVIGRLAPMDYHRFHFPFDAFVQKPKRINGYLYSVNPIALTQNISILSQNKRMLTILESKRFGVVLFVEIGATNVGSIQQTFTPERVYRKGEEKGYFSLGGSSIVLLFQKDRIHFDKDLLEQSEKKIEVRAFFGQSLGAALKPNK